MSVGSTKQDTAGERLLRVRDLAAMLDISQRQIWKLLAAGRLPQPVRLGRSVRWRAAAIDAWIERGCPAGDAGRPGDSPADGLRSGAGR